MDFRFAKLKRLLLLAGAMTVSFAQAQTLMSPGRPIIFSAPDGGDSSSGTPSLVPQPPPVPDFEVRAPDFNFKNLPASRVQMPVLRPMPPAPARDPRADWALMTPAEILGVATPEQILKIPERDAAGQPKNPTALERYYTRQDQAQTNGGVNGGFLSGKASLRGNFSDNEHGRTDTNGFNPDGGGFGNLAQWADSVQRLAPGGGMAADQNGDAGWSKVFSSPPMPVQNPAQAADMAEFQKLLEPNHPSKSSSAGEFISSSQTRPASTFGQPANPASFGSFNNTIGGLPGVAGQAVVPTVAIVPDWRPQPAPWLSQGPQPGAIPRRKF